MTDSPALPVETLAALAALRAPFPPESVGVLPKPTSRDNPPGRCSHPGCSGWHGLPAVHLPYVGHAAVTDRLLDADPSWSWEPVAFGPDGLPMLDPSGGLWIRLTVCAVTRYGYGDAAGSRGADAVKVAIGDALRNAAMRFGIALDLWTRDELPSQTTAAAPAEPFDVDGWAQGVRELAAGTSDLADLRALYADIGDHADRVAADLVLELRALVTERAEVVGDLARQDAATEPEPSGPAPDSHDADLAAAWPQTRQPGEAVPS